jgi:hypothetical protein
LWTFEVSNGLSAPDVAVDSNGDVAVYGGTHIPSSLRKLDGSTGATVWGPVPTGPSDASFDMAFAPDGSLLVVFTSFGMAHPSLLQRRSELDGTVIWESEVSFSGHIAVDSQGNAFVLGWDGSSQRMSKYSGISGALLWGPVQVAGYDLLLTTQGDPVVGGGGAGATAAKLDGATGVLLWETSFGQGTFYYHGVAVDPSGDVFLSGTAADPTFADVVTARLSTTDGSYVWGPVTYDSGDNEHSLVLGLDPLGNLVVGGAIAPGLLGLGYRSLMLGYDAEAGTSLWGLLVGEEYESVEFAGSGGGLLFAIERLGRQLGPDVRAFTFGLGVATPPGDVLIECGEPLSLQLDANNELGAVTWSFESGSLPSGVTLTPGGLLSGTPTEVGEFPIRVRVEDSTAASATRDLTIVVQWTDPIPIVVAPLSDCQFLLQVPGSWDSYSWEPGGEPTASIIVSPMHDTVYGVTVSDAGGCAMRGTVLIRATRRIDPSCDAPAIFQMTDSSGPASGGMIVGLNGTQFQVGATIRIGGLDAMASVTGPTSAAATTPALQPGALHTVLLTNPDGTSAFSPERFFADFLDVDQQHPFHDFVETLVRARVTAGCGDGNYCPDSLVQRDQIAVFLLRSRYGPTYEPPPATGTVFGDVNVGTFAGNYIEALAAAGVTGGCGGGNYCPADPVTRAQLSVFLLRTLEGPAYNPPPETGLHFTDVPVGSFAAAWIEELFERGITAGCDVALFCPDASTTRGQMAVFLVVTFGL